MNIEGVREAAVIGVPDEHPRPGGEGVRRARAGRARSTRARHPARVPAAARELHGAEVRRVRRRAAEDDHRQDQEDGALVSERSSADPSEPGDARESVEVAAAYESGKVGFMGLELFAAPGALVPRKETEILARTAIERLAALASGLARPLVVVDMCCGAGNLACAIAVRFPDAQLFATDLTDSCVTLTRRNVEKLGVSARVQVRQGDLFQGLAGAGIEGAVDAVVCNPPYISHSRLEKRSDLAREPREAFDGGPYGLSNPPARHARGRTLSEARWLVDVRVWTGSGAAARASVPAGAHLRQRRARPWTRQ